MFNCWNLRKAKRHNNRLHVAHDSCHLFTGPTFGPRWPPLAPVGPRVSIGPHWPPLAPISSHWPPLAPVGTHWPPSLKCECKHDAISTRSMPTMNAMTNKPKQTNISARREEHTRIQTQCFQRVHAVQLTSASMPVHSSCPFGRLRPPLMPLRRPCSVAPQRICAMRALQHHNA